MINTEVDSELLYKIFLVQKYVAVFAVQ